MRITLLVSSVLVLAVACGGNDNGEPDANAQPTGAPCTANSQCRGGNPTCIDNRTFSALTDGKDIDIPDGYCSELGCSPGGGEESCGPGGYCFNLEQYAEIPLSACFEVCETKADCRDGYDCLDGSEYDSGFDPMPHKACLPPELVCLLDIPHETCPNAGMLDAGAGAPDAGAPDAGAGAPDAGAR